MKAVIFVLIALVLVGCGSGGTATVTETVQGSPQSPVNTFNEIPTSIEPTRTPTTVTCGWLHLHYSEIPNDSTNQGALASCLGARDDELVTIDS